VPLLEPRVAKCLKGFSVQEDLCFKQKVPLSGGLLSVATRILEDNDFYFRSLKIGTCA